MASPFIKKIRTSLSDLDLQTALDNNSERRLTALHQAYSSLPADLLVMRRRAHQVRKDVIDNLERYQKEFIEQVKDHGIKVHQAATAQQAVGFVLGIAATHSTKLVAKSKSMVSEEIHLNRALLQAGIKVVETDLGEFIIQLRGEPPSHIITPAVHLRRSDVARVFEKELNIPYTEDIDQLTDAARATLRDTFLNAELGISGINFGVAENGCLCLVTNEGNGRMVTTLPAVHIALMGIERLVPTMEDLALMLYLLPRSATGQKLTVYTNLIFGPSGMNDIDGPQERHLILVDNGRSKLRNSALRESLYCIRCGACLNACPVFREIGGHAYIGKHGQPTTYPGPIGSVISPGLFGGSEFGHLAHASSLCGACREACPVDINLPELLLRVRAGMVDGHAENLSSSQMTQSLETKPIGVNFTMRAGLRVFTWIAKSPSRFAAAQRTAGLLSRFISPPSDWIRLPNFTGWGYSKDFPHPAKTAFRIQYRELEQNIKADSNLVAEETMGRTVSGNIGIIDETRDSLVRDQSLVDRFSKELTALGGIFESCPVVELPGKIIRLLQERNIYHIQSWCADELPAGLLEELERMGIRATCEPAEEIQVGLTGVLVGIAETGTLVLTSGECRPQSASLLPPVHLAILKSADIYESLPEVLDHLKNLKVSSAILISGPSRTADIEMTLTIGVHGPGELHVFCLE